MAAPGEVKKKHDVNLQLFAHAKLYRLPARWPQMSIEIAAGGCKQLKLEDICSIVEGQPAK